MNKTSSLFSYNMGLANSPGIPVMCHCGMIYTILLPLFARNFSMLLLLHLVWEVESSSVQEHL